MNVTVSSDPQCALITGGSQGLGLAFAHGCARRGIDLLLVALPDSGLEEAATMPDSDVVMAAIVGAAGLDRCGNGQHERRPRRHDGRCPAVRHLRPHHRPQRLLLPLPQLRRLQGLQLDDLAPARTEGPFGAPPS